MTVHVLWSFSVNVCQLMWPVMLKTQTVPFTPYFITALKAITYISHVQIVYSKELITQPVEPGYEDLFISVRYIARAGQVTTSFNIYSPHFLYTVFNLALIEQSNLSSARLLHHVPSHRPCYTTFLYNSSVLSIGETLMCLLLITTGHWCGMVT